MVNTLEVTHRYLDSVCLVAESAGHDSSKGLLYSVTRRAPSQPVLPGPESAEGTLHLAVRKQEVLEGCVGNKQSMQDSIGVWWKKLGPSYRRADHRD